jgi:iron complex transport system substrate-binding protein
MSISKLRRQLTQASVFAALTPCGFPALAAPPATPLPRLITLGGALTEIVYLLGAQDQLVGTDTTSLYPLAAQKTPKVGYLRQLSAEGLLSLRPDAVVASGEAGPPLVLEQLRAAGVRVNVIEADHSWAEVRRKVAAVGIASRREEPARALQQHLDAQWQNTLQVVASGKGQPPRVLFILTHSQSPSVSGQGTAADAVIRLAGGVNAMQGFNNYRPLTAEALAQAAPEVILTSTQGIEAQGGVEKFWSRPELALTPAFKRRTLVHMDALELTGFGPRLPATVRSLHERFLLAPQART